MSQGGGQELSIHATGSEVDEAAVMSASEQQVVDALAMVGCEQFLDGLGFDDGAATDHEVDEAVLHERSVLDADADLPLRNQAFSGAAVSGFLLADRKGKRSSPFGGLRFHR